MGLDTSVHRLRGADATIVKSYNIVVTAAIVSEVGGGSVIVGIDVVDISSIMVTGTTGNVGIRISGQRRSRRLAHSSRHAHVIYIFVVQLLLV